MRLWHKDLLDSLPDLQFKGQLRECVAIMRDWRDKGNTNHVLINKVMEYEKDQLSQYFWEYANLYYFRYHKSLQKYVEEFNMFSLGTRKALRPIKSNYLYNDWHNKVYLRMCMANLYEKHFFGLGKSKISEEEWQKLLHKYKVITGEEYEI